MRILPAALLLSVSLVPAKGVTPWMLWSRPEAVDPPAEEQVFFWKDGAWASQAKTGYAYDAGGALVHAEAWSAGEMGMRYKGTWSWDFAFGEDYLPTGVRERVLSDPGWKDTLRMPVEVRRDFRTENGDRGGIVAIWDGARIIYGSKVLTAFDAYGKPIASAESWYDAGAWVPRTRTTYAYGAAGRLADETVEGVSRRSYAYDTRGNLLSSTLNVWQSGAWRAEQKEEREYDSQGRPVLSTSWGRVPGTAGPLSPNLKTTHAYPSPAVHESSEWGMGDAGWIRQSLYRERFDDRGNVAEKIINVELGSGWAEASKSVYGYDDGNRQTDLAEYVKEGGAWIPASRSHSGFDSRGRVTGGYQEYFDAGILASRQEYEYRFDPRGNLVESVTREKSPAGTILGGTRALYAYAAPSALVPRKGAARSGPSIGAGRRGNAFLIRTGRASLDLRGRLVTPR